MGLREDGCVGGVALHEWHGSLCEDRALECGVLLSVLLLLVLVVLVVLGLGLLQRVRVQDLLVCEVLQELLLLLLVGLEGLGVEEVGVLRVQLL